LKLIAPIAAALLLLAAAAGAARADRVKAGNVIVDFDGGIAPKSLPRSGAAPISVAIESAFAAADGSDPPPQLRKISIGINRQGRLFSRGLPTCRVGRIQPSTIAAAKRICGGAIVGNGRVGVRVSLPNQKPFDFSGPLLAFNAKPHKGKRRLLAQVYGLRPPSAFVLTFRIRRKGGAYGTVIETNLPRSARDWAYVTRFEMTLRRTYVWRGKRRSYLSAGCPAPAGFPGAIYPFARAKFNFAEGQRVVSEETGNCKVR
jgi:hypothetical protein